MRSFSLLCSKLRSLRCLSTATKISILFLLIAGSFGISAIVQAQQATRAPIRAPAQQGIGAQDRNPLDFAAGLVDDLRSQLTDTPVSSNGNAAAGAVNDLVTDPSGTISTELTDAARQAGITGTGSITDILTARIVGLLAFLMGLVVSFLGKIILLLVNILLGFLTYNGFADAPPVVIGWKMVRDLANMFFIVVLIISSYATILGGKSELHVKNILPKILLAAVLVNFSKTIVALLIDASQIVMLTFVNSFASIGAGNFTNALHLPLISEANYANELQASVSSTAQSVAASGAGQVILDVILASALQIFLLVVAIGIMLMMVIFVVARIVGLWMLLIFSPMAFLADALPGSMKNILGKQISSFWPRLSGLLTGGPVMAFWLWLTFATLSAQGADERLGLFQNTQAAAQSGVFNIAQSGASMFITAIGNAQGLGSYVIAIAMMMMALEAAMTAADSVKETGGGLMRKVGNKSRELATGAAKFMGYGAAAGAAGWMARGARDSASNRMAAFDRRTDIRGKLAGAARRVVPGDNKWLREQQFKNRNENIKRAMEESKILNNPLASEEEKQMEMDRLRRDFGVSGSAGAKKAIADDALRTAGNEKAFDTVLKASKDKLKDDVKAKTNDAVVSKRVSDRYGKQEAAARRIAKYEEAKALITDNSQQSIDKRREIDDAIKKIRKDNPHLIRDQKERDKQMAEVKQNFNSLDEDARGNFEVLKNFAVDGAFKEDKATGKISIGDAAAIRATRKKLSGQNKENFDAMVNYVKESKDGVAIKDLRNLSAEKDAADRTRVFQAQTNADGEITGGGFKLSYQREQAVDKVKTDYSDAKQAIWQTTQTDAYGHTTSTVVGGAADDLVQAARTVGVSQVVQNVGNGASGAQADEQKQAAVNGLAAQTSSGLSTATAYMKEKDKFVDTTTGKEVEKSRADILRDGKAPDAVKDRIRAEYQSKVNEVLPMLDGVNELPESQQIDFMAAMGQANVGVALNAGNMSDPDMKASVQKVKMMVNENAEAVRGYFADENQEKMQDFGNYRQQEEYFKSQSQLTLDEYEDLSKKSDVVREAMLKGNDAKQAGYNEYVRNSNLQAQVSGKGIVHDPDFADQYAKYRKYDDARKAINQFNATGGKGSASSARTRSGGGKGRGGRGTP